MEEHNKYLVYSIRMPARTGIKRPTNGINIKSISKYKVQTKIQ